MENEFITQACHILGGQVVMARLLNVTPAYINQLVSGKRTIPANHCPTIERATKGAVRCEQLRADVDWAILRKKIRSAT